MNTPYPKAMAARPTLRQSLLSDFDNCALTTKFGLDYRQGWDSHPQGRGKLFHEFAAKALEEMHRQDSEQIEVDVALAILHEVLRQEHVDDVCHQPGCDRPARVLPEAEREDGRHLLCDDGHRHYSDVVNVPMSEIADLYWVVKKWAYDTHFDVRNLISTEERLEAIVSYPHPDGGTVDRIVTGQTDAQLLDAENPQHMIVLDWKDTWALPAPTEVSFEGYFQQRFYALLVMRNYKTIEQVTLREFYVRFSEPREATITRDKLPDIEAEVAALAERFDRAFETNVWKPTPGRHCNFCPRPTACPIPVFTRGEGRVVDAEHAEKVAAQLLVAEVVVNQTRKALRAYVTEHGPVPVKDAKGESFWAFREVEREKKPTIEQATQAEADGTSVASLFKKSKGSRFERITMKPGVTLKAGKFGDPEKPTAEDDDMMEKLRLSIEQAQQKRDAA